MPKCPKKSGLVTGALVLEQCKALGAGEYSIGAVLEGATQAIARYWKGTKAKDKAISPSP
jgi:hypothetical protein